MERAASLQSSAAGSADPARIPPSGSVCPACGNQVPPNVFEEFHHYRLLACRSCGLWFWDPREMPDARWYQQMYGGRDTMLLPLEPGHRFFLSHSDAPRTGCLLDIGCGTGNFLLAARKAGYIAAGTELDPGAARFAREACGLESIFPLSIQQFVQQHPAEKFDVVTFFEVLEHQADPSSFLRSVLSVLRPGGYIALSVPNRLQWTCGKDPLDYPPNHFLRWDPVSLRNFLCSHGFEILSLWEQPATVAFTARILNIKLRTGISRHVAPELASPFREVMQADPQQLSQEVPSQLSTRARLFQFFGRLKLAACYPLALVAMPYVRWRGYRTGYLCCLARKKNEEQVSC